MKTRAIIVLSVLMALPLAAYSKDKPFQELKDASERIQISNFINALSLNDRQMDLVYKSALKAGKMRAEAKKEIAKNYSSILEAYGNLEDEVAQGRVVVEDDTARDFHRAKKKIEGIKNGLEKEIDRLAANIRNSFAGHQLYAASGFTPCLVPRIQEGRIGQEGSHKGLVKVLEKIRSLPWDVYVQRKRLFIERSAEKLQENLPYLRPKQISSYKAVMSEVFDQARRMNDIDFSISKEQLAEKIKNTLEPKNREQSPEAKIKNFLLSDQTAGVIEKMRCRTVNSLAKTAVYR